MRLRRSNGHRPARRAAVSAVAAGVSAALPATGRIQHVVAVWVNRIGEESTNVRSPDEGYMRVQGTESAARRAG